MACEWIKLPDGTIVHLNLGKKRHACRSLCRFCRKPNHWISLMCDFPVGHGKTCDAGMCSECSTNVRKGIDYCPIHKGQKAPATNFPD